MAGLAETEGTHAMPTIGDVAAKANVSTATVSRALNGKSSVDPELAQRVLEAATQLGYQPHGPARNLRRKSTAIFSLIISSMENPYFTSIAHGFADVAKGGGYSVLLGSSDDDPALEQYHLGVALQERVAGVVMSPTNDSTDISQLIARGTPLVTVDRPLGGTDCDRVLVDGAAAAATATERLIDQGYRRIGCIGGPPGLHTADQRLTGFKHAHERAGRIAEPHLMSRADPRNAADVADALLDLPDRPDALLITDSAVTVEVLQAIEARGLRLGSDLGVIAFDDTPWATLLRPALSVVDQPGYEIGATAAQLLLDRLDDPSMPPREVLLSTRVVARGSSQRTA